jgi:hypothetical protein
MLGRISSGNHQLGAAKTLLFFKLIWRFQKKLRICASVHEMETYGHTNFQLQTHLGLIDTKITKSWCMRGK